jgi:flagellar hook-length control protein FliK
MTQAMSNEDSFHGTTVAQTTTQVGSVVWRRRSAVASGQGISTGLRTTLLGPLADSDRQQPMTYTDTTHRRIDARVTQTGEEYL